MDWLTVEALREGGAFGLAVLMTVLWVREREKSHNLVKRVMGYLEKENMTLLAVERLQSALRKRRRRNDESTED